MPRRFTISEAHMHAFGGQQRNRFVEEMKEHLSLAYPQQVRELGDDDLRTLIENGIEKARSFEIVLESDVCRFIEFMVSLGPDFDVNPRTAWARHILSARRGTARYKLDRLEAKVAADRRGRPPS